MTKTNGSQKYVSIADVPELIPTIQEYNRAYDYLSSGDYSPHTGRSATELDLDLEHILKVVGSNGKESYSINIKKAFDDYQDIFFENLHIYEKDGSLTSKILKYNPLDDSEKFDMNTFTGSVEMYDKDGNLQGIFQYESGVQRCEKLTIGCYHIWYFASIDELWIWFDCGVGSGGDDAGGNGSQGNSGDGFGNGDGNGMGNTYGSTNGISNGNNGTAPNPSDPTLVDHTPIVPNNLWPVETTQLDMANRISSRLGLSLGIRSWMRNPMNIISTYETYDYMQPIQQIGDMNFDVISDGIQSLSGGGASFNPILLDDQITSSLPPCLDAILNDLKSLPNGKFGSVINQFAGLNPVPQNYNWTLATAYFPPSAPGMQPDAARTSGSNPAITTINNYYQQTSTDLSFARTMIHECFHAYLTCVYRFRNIDMSYVNLINQYSAQFNNNRNDIDHHLFAQNNIINHISQALMEYGTLKGYTLSQQFCDDMAWAGLIGTSAFSGLPQNQQDRIRSRLEAETFNTSNNLLNLNPVGHQTCP